MPSDLQEIAYYRSKNIKLPIPAYLSSGPWFESIIKDTRRSIIVYDSSKTVSKKDWSIFKDLIKEANFWNLPQYIRAGDTDGASWIIEAHTKARYKYIIRQSPGGGPCTGANSPAGDRNELINDYFFTVI